MGTLTSSISKSMHTSISPIYLHKSYSVATPEHSELLPPENFVCIVALTPDLRRVSFYSAIEFLYYSSTIELILSLMHIKGSYLSFKASLPCGKSLSALWLLWRANSSMVAMGIVTSSATNDLPSKFYP